MLKNIKIKKINNDIALKNYQLDNIRIRRSKKINLEYENIVIASDADYDRRKPVIIY